MSSNSPEVPEETPVAPEAPAAPARPAVRRPVLKKHIKKKEVEEQIEQQPDVIVQQGRPIVDWVLDRQRMLLGAVGAALAALFVWGVADSLSAGKRQEAATALFDARADLPSDDADSAAVADVAKQKEAIAKLEAVADAHDGTPQAAEALLQAGALAHASGDFEKALALFGRARSGDGIYALLAQSGEGYANEGLRRWDGAVAAFDALRGDAGKKAGLAGQAALDLARVYEAKGEPDKARGIYAAFETDFPDSLLREDAKARLAALGPAAQAPAAQGSSTP